MKGRFLRLNLQTKNAFGAWQMLIVDAEPS